MPTYEFNEGSLGFAQNFFGTQTIYRTDDSVRFAWSVNGGDGSNQIFYSPTGLGGNIGGTVGGGNNETFKLDALGTLNTDLDFLGGLNINVTQLSSGGGGMTTMFITYHLTGGGTRQDTVTATGTVTEAGNFSNVTFTFASQSAFFRINDVTTTVSCFAEGTRIDTPDGPVPVEDLQSGDLVTTADGRAVKVLWRGEQWIDTRLADPATVNPVCISRNALAPGVPLRDLWLSPDHAVGIDGMLVNAGALVNGRSVCRVQDMPLEGFTYYHVETEAHELLLAEGCAAESFIDQAAFARDSFDNAPEDPCPRLLREMPLPRISARRHLPPVLRARLDKAVNMAAGLDIAS